MNKILSKILIFAAGAVAGSIATVAVFKARYEFVENEVAEEPANEESKTDQEAQPMDRMYEKIQEFREAKQQRKADRAAARDICEEHGYGDQAISEGDDEKMDKPYIIPPEDVGEDYDVVSLNYYTDGVLADDGGNVIRNEDYGEFVGEDFADHFGDYEEDSVFVRNDVLEKDYEILMEYRPYSEVFGG